MIHMNRLEMRQFFFPKMDLERKIEDVSLNEAWAVEGHKRLGFHPQGQNTPRPSILSVN